jgi:hypothetical protein
MLSDLLQALSIVNRGNAHVAQPAEHILGKNEVMGSSPIVGSMPRFPMARFAKTVAGSCYEW